MSESDAIAALEAAPLFSGLQRRDLVEVARVMRHRSVAAGEVLWHQGAEAKGMALVVEGRVGVTLRLPGERAIEFAEVGPGETLGELPLIDGGPHSATAQVTESGSLLFFRRSDFAPFVSREDPSAYALNRRLAAVTAGRLRRQLQSLAASLERGSARSREAAPAHTPDRLAPATPPDGAYVRRMATFRAVDAAALDRFLAAGRYVESERGWTLEQEGAPAAAFYLVINGTVERVLIRDDRRIRVGLAGPGQAFGYEGLLDGAPSPATAIARERALLLALPEEAFARLYGTESSESLTFLDVINRDLAGWLRRAVRPQAHLAVRPIA